VTFLWMSAVVTAGRSQRLERRSPRTKTVQTQRERYDNSVNEYMTEVKLISLP